MKKIIACLLTCITLAGCAAPAAKSDASSVPVVTKDANPESIFCSDCYEAPMQTPGSRVAEWGGEILTAEKLRVFYQLVAADWFRSGAVQPEDGLPLWAQLCPMDGEKFSWEQFFLRRSIALWCTVSALNDAAVQPQQATDPGFHPSEDPLMRNFLRDFPLYDSIYGNGNTYTLPAMHRQYLDNLPGYLQTFAQKNDFSDVSALAERMGTNEKVLLSVCSDINRAYSYYVNLSARAPESPVPGTEAHVHLRQLLLAPEGKTDSSGTLYTESAVEALRTCAEEILNEWKSSPAATLHPEADFANRAHRLSDDTATAPDGGNLNSVAPGQLIAELDAWCFAQERRPGDTAVIPVPQGISVVYYGGKESVRTTAPAMQALIQALVQKNSMYVDYSAVCLPRADAVLSLSDILYPDIGHEQIDEVPTYFQQDYPYVNCGGTTMPIGGCGFACFAMLAAYLSDTPVTPTEIAQQYREEFGSPGGINGDIFSRIPPDFGFYCTEVHNQWDLVEACLAQGCQVVNLQMASAFTASGHYMLLAHVTDDGRIVVRDPSITHYAKLPGFRADGFESGFVAAGSALAWNFDKKILTIPACTRCGSGGCYALREDYLCRKCLTATDRRNGFLSCYAEIQN